MRIGVFVLVHLLVLTVLAVADERLSALTAGTNTYGHVTVFKVSATDIYFTSDKGLGNVKLKDLDPELQNHFHYNPTNAAAAEQRQKAADILYHVEIMKPSPATQAAKAEAAADQAAIREPGTGKQIWARSVLNQKMPEFIVEKWLNGEPDHRGKFVLIDFWASWDPASRAAIPLLNNFQREFGDLMIIIGLTDEPEAVVQKQPGAQMEYYVAIDSQGRTKKNLEVTGIPHILIIDPKGIVRWEGFPFLPGYELNEKVVVDIINKYSN